MDWLPVVLVLGAALVFAFTNGFQDASNVIAIPIATKSLSPRTAVTMAAVCVLVGALLGSGLALGLMDTIVAPFANIEGVSVIGAALIAATLWNLLMWWFGMPSSSTHALIGGLAGAAVVAGTAVTWDGVWVNVVIPMLVSPVAGLLLALVGVRLLARLVGDRPRRQVSVDLRGPQVAAAGAVALGNGLQDAAKTMAVMAMVLAVTGHTTPDARLPWGVALGAAVAVALGTYAGGWRIVSTLSRRIISPAPDPAQGTVAQTATAAIQYVATILHVPVSSTHTVTSALVGAGLSGRRSALRWDVIRRILVVWLCTFPGAGLLGAAVCGVFLAL